MQPRPPLRRVRYEDDCGKEGEEDARDAEVLGRGDQHDQQRAHEDAIAPLLARERPQDETDTNERGHHLDPVRELEARGLGRVVPPVDRVREGRNRTDERPPPPEPLIDHEIERVPLHLCQVGGVRKQRKHPDHDRQPGGQHLSGRKAFLSQGFGNQSQEQEDAGEACPHSERRGRSDEMPPPSPRQIEGRHCAGQEQRFAVRRHQEDRRREDREVQHGATSDRFPQLLGCQLQEEGESHPGPECGHDEARDDAGDPEPTKSPNREREEREERIRVGKAPRALVAHGGGRQEPGRVPPIPDLEETALGNPLSVTRKQVGRGIREQEEQHSGDHDHHARPHPRRPRARLGSFLHLRRAGRDGAIQATSAASARVPPWPRPAFGPASFEARSARALGRFLPRPRSG